MFAIAYHRSRVRPDPRRASRPSVPLPRQGKLFSIGAIAVALAHLLTSACVDQTFLMSPASSSPTTQPRGNPTPDPPAKQPTTGTLAGVVLVGPFSTTYTPGSSGSLPVIGATVVVSQLGTYARVGSALTDASGAYQVTLAAGAYVVTLNTSVQYVSTRDVPATVAIAAGQTTTLSIQLDTGLR